MLELLKQYYINERAGFVSALFAGIPFLLTGILLWIKFAHNPISKGLGVGLAISGTILIAGSFLIKQYNEKKIEGLSERKAETALQLQQSELQRMDKVMNVTFRYAFVTFAVLIPALLLVSIYARSYFWKGFCIAFLLLVTFFFITDTFNHKKNKDYLTAVKALKCE